MSLIDELMKLAKSPAGQALDMPVGVEGHFCDSPEKCCYFVTIFTPDKKPVTMSHIIAGFSELQRTLVAAKVGGKFPKVPWAPELPKKEETEKKPEEPKATGFFGEEPPRV